jgi:hypothetical protein
MEKQKGQIAIISLFSIAVLTIIGGSIVTQVVFEQKKAVLEEKNRQAYYAAESGIENALQEIINSGDISTTTLTVGQAQVGIESASIGGGSSYLVPTKLYSGESSYLNLQGYNSGDAVRVCWDKAGTGIIVTYFYLDGSGVLRSNHYALNSLGSVNITGGVASSRTTSGMCGIAGTVYYADLGLPTGTPAYMLTWIAYQDEVQLAFGALGTSNFIDQSKIITSTAEISEVEGGVTRELKYSVSRTASGSFIYPPSWLTVPLYAESGITYANE